MNKKIMLVLLFQTTRTLAAQQPEVTSSISKNLTDFPGREVLMITEEYLPGRSDTDARTHLRVGGLGCDAGEGASQ